MARVKVTAVNVLKLQKFYSALFGFKFDSLNLIFTQLFLKMLSGMAKSVNPDQTAPSSDLGLFVYDILSETLEYKHLGYFMSYRTIQSTYLAIILQLFDPQVC